MNSQFSLKDNFNLIMKLKQEMNAMNGAQLRDVIEQPNTSTPLKPEYNNYIQNTSRNTASANSCSSTNDVIASANYMSEDQNQKGTRFLGAKAVAVLNDWFHENRDYPYPDDATTDYLAKKAEISVKQVKKWFANKRVRSQLCCKPMNRNRKKYQMNQTLNDSNSQQPTNQAHQTHQPDHEQTKLNYLNQHLLNINQMSSKRYQHQLNGLLTHASPPSAKLPQFNHPYLNPFLQQSNQTQPNLLNNQTNLLRSMSYLNPMLMMNLLSQQQQQQQHHHHQQAILNLANSRQLQNQNYLKTNTCEQSKSSSSTTTASSSSTSSASDDQLNDSISAESDSEDNNQANSIVYAESYDDESETKDSHHSSNKHDLDEDDLPQTNLDLISKHTTNTTKLNSISESSGTSSISSNYTDHSNSLINLHSSPTLSSSSSSSVSSSSNNTPINSNDLVNKKTIEKKINFAIISTLID